MNDYDRGRCLDKLNTLLKLDPVISNILCVRHACTGKLAESGEVATEDMYGGRVHTVRLVDIISSILGVNLELSIREDGTIRKVSGKNAE